MKICIQIRAIGLLCCLLLTQRAFSQTTRYVSTTGTTAAASATSWAASTTDLQGAINASQAGDQVWVAAGVYKPATTTGPDSRTISFSMKNGVAIYGGFVGNETLLGQRPVINPVTGSPGSSTLSGETGSSGSTADNSYHVIYNPASLSLTNTAVLDGFVITGGNANANSSPHDAGGGVYNNGRGSGAVCSPVFRNCSFISNSAGYGGALYNNGNTGQSSPVLINCALQGNSATEFGGVMLNDGRSNGLSSPVLINCSLQNNTAVSGGAAIFNLGISNGRSNPVLVNCSLQGNSASQGGVMYSNGDLGQAKPVLTNCVVWNNGSSPFFNLGTTGASATYSLLDNPANVDITGPGNLTAVISPFVSASSVALLVCSPAINAGNPASQTAASGPYSATALPATDLAGNPRIFGTRVDMGAVEYQSDPVPPARLYVAASQTATAGDGLSWATAFPDLQSALTYPCSQSLTEIWVAAGTYRPASGGSFSMLPGVAIYGGFAGGETVLSQRPSVNPVTTEGHPGSPSNTTLAGNGSRVINNPASLSLTRSAVLDGFVITGGRSGQGGGVFNDGSSPTLTNCLFQGNQATGGSDESEGGAIFNVNSSNPRLTNCSFLNNQVTGSASNYGGAISNIDSNPVLTNCLFVSNQAAAGSYSYGGAIANRSSSPVLTNCLFQSNQVNGGVYRYGGAVYNINSSNPVLTNCSFQSNQITTAYNGGQSYGGAISNRSSSPELTNCSFQDNQITGGTSSQNYGGAISNTNGSTPLLTNCLFQDNQITGGNSSYNNGGAMANINTTRPVLTNCSFQSNQITGGTSSQNYGGAISNVGSSSAVLTNAVVWNNGGGSTFYNFDNSSTLTATYSLFDNTSGVDITGPGNLTTTISPFVSATSVALAACSPAINAGNPASATAASGPYSATALPATDLTGNVRISNGRIDMGAVEYQQQNGVPLQIVQQPVAGSIVCAGTTVVMSVSLTGSAPAYQWYRSGTALTGIASATTASLTLTDIQTTDAGNYSVVISGDCPSVTSTAFSLSVNALPSVTVTAAPSATLSCANPSLTLTAQTSATAFAWSSGGSTGQTLPVSQTGVYSVTVTGANGCTAVSNGLTIGQDKTSPTVSVSAISNQLTCAQPQLTLTATASATALRWSTGQTTTTISVSTTGVYSVTATGSNGCTAVSNNLTIAQDKTSPTVSVSALSSTLTCAQPQLTLTATASATTLRWSTGETAATIAVSTTGVYSVTATGSNGCTAVSNGLTIGQDKASPTVSVSALSSTLTCTQPQLTLTATASATALRWSTGETAATIAVSMTGVYSVTATGSNGCTAVSNGLTIGQDKTSPTVSVSALSTTLTCTQPQLTLTATASVTALRWSTGETTATISVSTAGTYSVTATSPNGCTVVSNNLSVTGNFSLPPFTVSSATVCPGQSVNLTASGCGGQVRWPNGTTGSMITLTAGSSTSLLTATCTVGVCATTASGQVVVGGIQPPPAQILSFTADESACPVRLSGRGVASSFTMTGPKDYVFSTVYREGGMRDAVGLNVTRAGTYTLTAVYTNSCGSSAPVTRTVTVDKSCP